MNLKAFRLFQALFHSDPALLRHQWCGQDHAISCARSALRNSEASVKEVDHLLGLLSPEMLPLGLVAPRGSEMLRRHSPRQPMQLGFERHSSLSSHITKASFS